MAFLTGCEPFWRVVAKILARPFIVDWLIHRAEQTPYDHLLIHNAGIHRVHNDYPLNVYTRGESWYMRRFWLLRFGPLQIRLHNILSEDIGRDLHSHPWPFRTFILRGWYFEKLADDGLWSSRLRGETKAMDCNDAHRIYQISQGGVWTLFCTWGKPKTWGFLVDGKMIDHNEYVQ